MSRRHVRARPRGLRQRPPLKRVGRDGVRRGAPPPPEEEDEDEEEEGTPRGREPPESVGHSDPRRGPVPAALSVPPVGSAPPVLGSGAVALPRSPPPAGRAPP